jgi:hypothetical protein
VQAAINELDAEKIALAGGTMTGPLVLSGDPTLALHAVPKQYADALIAGFDFKGSVRAATTTAGTLASSFENGDTIDGVVLATGDRILIKDQAAAAENGIYVVAASGAPARSSDADASAEVTAGLAVVVEDGTVNADKVFFLTTNAPIVLGTTALTFAALNASASSLGVSAVVKAADESVTSSTTLQADDDLTIAVAATRSTSSSVGCRSRSARPATQVPVRRAGRRDGRLLVAGRSFGLLNGGLVAYGTPVAVNFAVGISDEITVRASSAPAPPPGTSPSRGRRTRRTAPPTVVKKNAYLKLVKVA